jgi:phosphatidylinositol-3-phosphatase
MFLRTCAFLFLLPVFLFSSFASGQSDAVPQFRHVIVLVEENQNYDAIVGSAAMPYLNGLANQYGLATQFYANTHPSIGNYFMMTTGEVITNETAFACPVSVDNIVRRLATAGKTWKVYAENLPSVGYTGGDVYPYAKHHNPFAYFSDVLSSSTEQQNIVPFPQFATDVNTGSLPNFSFIVPNMQSNTHDCPPGMQTCTNTDKLAYGDQWLQNNLGQLISNPVFQQDGLLIITFDEAEKSDLTHGGGRVATLLVSPKVKSGFRSTTFYQHQHLLRTILTALGMNSSLGASKYVGDMAEFFQPAGAGSISGTVTNAVTGAPISGASVSGPGSATTDSAGSYSFASVAAGFYTLTASASGYQSSSSSLTVTSGANSTQNFALNPVSNASLSGRVISAVDGRAVSGVTVSYSGGSTLTNTTGNYSFASVTPGTYAFSTSRSGWLSSTQNATIAPGEGSTLNFQISTAGKIKGTVTNSSGAPIAGARVTITGGVIATNKVITTSSSGTYSSDWIPVGTYTVTAQSGSLSKTQSTTFSSGQTATANFTLP